MDNDKIDHCTNLVDVPRKLAQLADDERRISDLTFQAGVIMALSVLCCVAAAVTITSSRFAALFILAGGHGIFYGLHLFGKVSKLKMFRYSADYLISSFQLDRGPLGRPTKSPYRPHIFTSNNKLIGILFDHRDVEEFIEHHIRNKPLTDWWLANKMVPEFATIKAKHDKEHIRRQVDSKNIAACPK